MIIAGYWPGIYRFINICLAIFICVNQLCKLATLGTIQRSTFVSNTQHLVHARGKFSKVWSLAGWVLYDVYISAAGRYGHMLVRFGKVQRPPTSRIIPSGAGTLIILK